MTRFNSATKTVIIRWTLIAAVSIALMAALVHWRAVITAHDEPIPTHWPVA
jgi:hypothetical protein